MATLKWIGPCSSTGSEACAIPISTLSRPCPRWKKCRRASIFRRDSWKGWRGYLRRREAKKDKHLICIRPPGHLRARPRSKGREIRIGLVIAIFFITQLFPLGNAENLSLEEMARHSSGGGLLRLLWVPLARALLFSLPRKTDCPFRRAGHFRRRLILARSFYLGTGGDCQMPRLRLAKASLCMA